MNTKGMRRTAQAWADYIELEAAKRGFKFESITLLDDVMDDPGLDHQHTIVVLVKRAGHPGAYAVVVYHDHRALVFFREFGGSGSAAFFGWKKPADMPEGDAARWIDGLVRWAGDERGAVPRATQYRYIGPLMYTRGDYGEEVAVVHRGNIDPDGNFAPNESGEVAAVWDATFGFIPEGSFRKWDEDGVLAVLERK